VFTVRYVLNLYTECRLILAFKCLPYFDPKSVHVRFVVGKLALGKDFLRVLPFSPPVSFLHFSTLIFMYSLLLPEGQIDEFQKKLCSLGI